MGDVAHDPSLRLQSMLARGVRLLPVMAEVKLTAMCLDGDLQVGNRKVNPGHKPTTSIKDIVLTNKTRNPPKGRFDPGLER